MFLILSAKRTKSRTLWRKEAFPFQPVYSVSWSPADLLGHIRKWTACLGFAAAMGVLDARTLGHLGVSSEQRPLRILPDLFLLQRGGRNFVHTLSVLILSHRLLILPSSACYKRISPSSDPYSQPKGHCCGALCWKGGLPCFLDMRKAMVTTLTYGCAAPGVVGACSSCWIHEHKRVRRAFQLNPLSYFSALLLFSSPLPPLSLTCLVDSCSLLPSPSMGLYPDPQWSLSVLDLSQFQSLGFFG